MRLPIRPAVFIAVSVATGVSGLAVATVGGVQMRHANAQIKRQATSYLTRHREHEAKIDETNLFLQQLGRTQKDALDLIIFRMCAFLERHAKQVKANEFLILDGVDDSKNEVLASKKLDLDVLEWVQGVTNAALVGMATPIVLKTAATKLAAASTGTAIASLQGVAATNATLAWFGGGSLAAGGGGMALGATVLNVTIAGPTLLVAGITVKNRGTIALTEATEHLAATEVLLAELDVRDELLEGVQARTVEVDTILKRLMLKASDELDLLESEEFDMDRHGERLQRALTLVKAVRDVARAPISDKAGHLDEDTNELIFKYRNNLEGAD